MAEIAESAKEGLLALAAGTGLQCDVSQSADSEDRDRLGGSDPGDLDRLVGRHPRARQRHGIAGGDAVWHQRRTLPVRRRTRENVPVDGVARVLLLLT